MKAWSNHNTKNGKTTKLFGTFDIIEICFEFKCVVLRFAENGIPVVMGFVSKCLLLVTKQHNEREHTIKSIYARNGHCFNVNKSSPEKLG